MRTAVVLSVAGLVAACGGSGEAGPGGAGAGAGAAAPAAETKSLPRGGDVWEIDPAATPDAQVLAYLHGLHTFVRAGDNVFTATTRLTDVREDGSALVIRLDTGLEARIDETSGSRSLKFSSGPSAALREHKKQGEGT